VENKMILKSLLYSAVKPLPINLVYNQSSPVLLYHSIGKETDFKRNIDHIDLDFLENHIRELKKKWKFVSIDEYSQASSKKGLASITIDDGYKNIINEAISVLKTTIFQLQFLLIQQHLMVIFFGEIKSDI
jgi:hypothetical protein